MHPSTIQHSLLDKDPWPVLGTGWMLVAHTWRFRFDRAVVEVRLARDELGDSSCHRWCGGEGWRTQIHHHTHTCWCRSERWGSERAEVHREVSAFMHHLVIFISSPLFSFFHEQIWNCNLHQDGQKKVDCISDFSPFLAQFCLLLGPILTNSPEPRSQYQTTHIHVQKSTQLSIN